MQEVCRPNAQEQNAWLCSVESYKVTAASGPPARENAETPERHTIVDSKGMTASDRTKILLSAVGELPLSHVLSMQR